MLGELAPDFSDPIGLIEACHGRIVAQCELLRKMIGHQQRHGADPELASAATRVLRYFDIAAPLHHQDEEQDLFPLLNRQSLKLADIVFRLKQDHEKLDQLWQQLLPDLKKPGALAENPDFGEHAAAFCAGYRAHIETEEKQLLDMARHILSEKQLQEMGRAMARRRGQRR